MSDPSPESVAPSAILPAIPGQAALFEDPRRLLTLPIPELHRIAAEVAWEGVPIFSHLRRVFGLIAWAVWNQSSELAYSEWELGYAERLCVASPTLRRWRRDVVAAEDLPIPTIAALRSDATRRGLSKAATNPGNLPPTSGFHLYRLWTSEGRLLYVGISTKLRQRLGSHQRHFGEQMARATWEELPDAEAMLAAEAAAIRDECPAINKMGSNGGSKVGSPNIPLSEPPEVVHRPLPNPGPPPSTRANVAHLLDHLHALDPDEIGAAMTAGELDVLMGWTERVVKAAPVAKTRRSVPAPKSKPAKSSAATKPKAGPKCPHPITRRIGENCGICLESVSERA